MAGQSSTVPGKLKAWCKNWGKKRVKLERAMGIEPTFEAWEAPVLPLNYTRVLFWESCDLHHKVRQNSPIG